MFAAINYEERRECFPAFQMDRAIVKSCSTHAASRSSRPLKSSKWITLRKNLQHIADMLQPEVDKNQWIKLVQNGVNNFFIEI